MRIGRANPLINFGNLLRLVALLPMPMKHKDCEERNEPATLTERGLPAI